MILYQIWVNDRLEETLKNENLDSIKAHCTSTWSEYCKEPYPAKVPEIWWTDLEEPPFVTGYFYWWPHKPFKSEEEAEQWFAVEHNKGHYIRFEILPVELG